MAKHNNISDTQIQQESPTEEQVKDLILFLDKEKMLLSGLKGVDMNGKLKTAPADDGHNNEFLRINPSDYWLETFAKNFYSQLKDPTKFTLIKIKESDLEDPLVKQAMKDINDGKITNAVVQFIDKHQIQPQDKLNINQKNTKEMAKQNQTQDSGTVEQQQPPRYRYNENMIDWEDLKKHGVSREYLESKGLLDTMLKGSKTNQLVPVAIDTGSVVMRADARLSFRQDNDGRIKLNIHALKQHPDLDKPFMGHIFSEDDKKNLLNQDPDNNTGYNMGRAVPLKSRTGEYVDSLISLDPMTNQISAVEASRVRIWDEMSGVKFTPEEKAALLEGKQIFVDELEKKNKPGETFEAHLQYNAEKRMVEFLFPKQYKMRYGQKMGGVELSKHQVDAYNAGKTIKVEDMVSKQGNLSSSFLTRNEKTGQMEFTRYNPENPGEIIIPKEINGIKVTAEEQKELSAGKPIYLYDMIGQDQQPYNGYIKLDTNTGSQIYSSTLEGFDQKQSFKIPDEVYGHKFSSKEKAALQDGKAILLSDLKGFDGKTFAQYAKMNQQGNKLNYFNDNPDIKRDATQRNAKTAVVKQTEDQKQEKKRGRSRSQS